MHHAKKGRSLARKVLATLLAIMFVLLLPLTASANTVSISGEVPWFGEVDRFTWTVFPGGGDNGVSFSPIPVACDEWERLYVLPGTVVTYNPAVIEIFFGEFYAVDGGAGMRHVTPGRYTAPGQFVIETPGRYEFGAETSSGDLSMFSITVVGNEIAQQPAPIPTPTPTPVITPVTPAPVVAVPVTAAVNLRTTDNLVTVLPPAPIAGQDLRYTVQAGEALWNIAFNFYGNMRTETINRIWAANAAYFRSTNGVLEAGAVIVLPAEGLIQPITQGSRGIAAGVYRVQAGDTLGAIAYHFFGNTNEWRRIAEANADRIRIVNGSPMIFEGQWIIIPR
ncbi:MAG: LysM peptidoglycan-binding domain-containing protein [Defluviitaleaceae bacterium]|nr:LysM peptidoglycan-binding domain-containing protein [Defluviitaleaceae bacterium]MCL2273777.1 LysM peptidoglycan-binding domain-containing protein [Defluviitaleaceae bacterium]